MVGSIHKCVRWPLCVCSTKTNLNTHSANKKAHSKFRGIKMGDSHSKPNSRLQGFDFLDFDFPRKSPDVTVSKHVYLKYPIINTGNLTLYY